MLLTRGAERTARSSRTAESASGQSDHDGAPDVGDAAPRAAVQAPVHDDVPGARPEEVPVQVSVGDDLARAGQHVALQELGALAGEQGSLVDVDAVPVARRLVRNGGPAQCDLVAERGP